MDLWEWEAICKGEKVHMGGLPSWECAGQGEIWGFQSCGYEQKRETSLPAEKSLGQPEELEKPRIYCKQAAMLAIKVKEPLHFYLALQGKKSLARVEAAL